MRKIQKILRKKSVLLGILMIILNLALLFNTNLMKINTDINDDEYINHQITLTLASISNYDFYKNITILSSQVSGSGNHSNFPLMISLIDSDLHEHCQDDGDDIAFYDEDTLLDYEIEFFNLSYTLTEAKLVAWVRIPLLSTSIDQTITMYFGNSTTMISQENPEGVWDNNYKGIWHLSETPNGTVYDSTSNDNDGSSSGTMTSSDQIEGRIDGGIEFDGFNDQIDCGDHSSLDITDVITLQFWIKGYEFIWQTPDIITKGLNREAYSLDISNSTVRLVINDNRDLESTTSLATNSWHHITCTYNGTGGKIYINGTFDYSDSLFLEDTDIESVNESLTISSGFPINGCLDEVRISNVVRSSDWILTEYNNQNDPESFYSIGILGVVGVDTTPPITELNFLSDYTEDYVNGSTTFLLNASDGAGLGVIKTAYKIDDDGNWVEYTTPFNLSGHEDGIHYILYNSTDNSNNTEITHNKTVYLYSETITPVTTIQFISDFTMNYVNASTTFSLNASDGAGSGVSDTYYRIDNGGLIKYNLPFNLSGEFDGTIRIQYHSTDMTNNSENPHEKLVYLYNETTPPTSILNINGNPATVYETTIFSLTGYDGVSGSGIAKQYFRIDDGIWQEYINPFTLYSLGLTEGNHIIEHYCIDYVGNNGSISSIEVNYALINPEDNTLLIVFISLLLLGIFITIPVIKVRKRTKVKTVKSKNIKQKYIPEKAGQLDENDLIVNVNLEVICPICNTQKKVEISEETINTAKSVATISIPKETICAHHFQVFVDKNLVVRGYQKVDGSVNPETEKTKRLVKDLKSVSDD